LTIVILTTAFSPASELKLKAPDIHAQQWINSEPLNWDTLQGKVVMVEFWTFECYNCKNVEPYVKAWYNKFHDKGFEIVAVHSPEFERERNINNVRQYVKDHSITYPVAIDNNFTIWRRFSNRYWPAMYLVDKQGNIRYRFIGEGRYAEIESRIESLLAEQ
jgi:glutathione peroxidase-family protein